MKNLKVIVKKFLELHSELRSRKLRALAIWSILSQQNWEGHEFTLNKDKFIQFGHTQIQSINRVINFIQRNYPDLRGSDYEDKKRLQQKVQVELGYNPGIDQQIKKLETL